MAKPKPKPKDDDNPAPKPSTAPKQSERNPIIAPFPLPAPKPVIPFTPGPGYTPVPGTSTAKASLRTQGVAQRLGAAEAAAGLLGDYDAAIAYATAARQMQLRGSGTARGGAIGMTSRQRDTLDQMQKIINSYTEARDRSKGPGPGPEVKPYIPDYTPDEGGAGPSYYAYAPPPPPEPVLPIFTEDKTKNFDNVKVAPKDTIVFNESDVNIELMQDLLFEDIGAIELANMSRYDLIDGQEVYYSPIKNLPSIKRRFDPNNIIASSTKGKSAYAIDLISKIGSGTITETTSANNVREVSKGVPYTDINSSGEVVDIHFYMDGLKSGEIVEIQLISNGTIGKVDAL